MVGFSGYKRLPAKILRIPDIKHPAGKLRQLPHRFNSASSGLYKKNPALLPERDLQ